MKIAIYIGLSAMIRLNPRLYCFSTPKLQNMTGKPPAKMFISICQTRDFD